MEISFQILYLTLVRGLCGGGTLYYRGASWFNREGIFDLWGWCSFLREWYVPFSCHQVTTNGMILFQNNTSQPLLLDTPPQNSTYTFISPLWTQFEFPSNDQGSIFSHILDDQESLDNVARMIAEHNSELSSYRPSAGVVVTWHRAKLPGNIPVSCVGTCCVSRLQVCVCMCMHSYVHERENQFVWWS